MGRSGVGCWERGADQQRHGEHDGWQVPDEVEAAVDGEGRCRGDHPSPGGARAAGGARAPQQARDRDQQDCEQDQAHQTELRRDLEVLVVDVREQLGAMVVPLPSQVGVSRSGAGQGMLSDQPERRVQRAGPVGGGEVGPGLGDRLGGAGHPAAGGKQPGGAGGQDATQQRERRPPRQPRHERGKDQPGAQANQRECRSWWAGGRHRRQQARQGHQGAGHRADRGPRTRAKPAQPGQHHQADHEAERARPAHRRGQPGQQPGRRQRDRHGTRRPDQPPEHHQADGRQHGRRRVGVGQRRGGAPQALGLERPRAGPVGDPQPAGQGHQQADSDHPGQQDLPVFLPEATADQQHCDKPHQQQRRPDTGAGEAHQGAAKDRPRGQGQRRNDRQQAEVIPGWRPCGQPKQGGRGDEHPEGPLCRGVVGALPEQPGGGGGQQQKPS